MPLLDYNKRRGLCTTSTTDHETRRNASITPDYILVILIILIPFDQSISTTLKGCRASKHILLIKDSLDPQELVSFSIEYI